MKKQNKYLVEYGYECELLGKEGEKYRIKIYNEDIIVEKLVNYEPVENIWEFDGAMVKNERRGFGVLKKYTVYNKNGKLVRAYKFNEIKEFSDNLVYETEIGKEYEIVKENPFLSIEEIEKLKDEEYKEKEPLLKENKELNNKIIENKKRLEEIEKKFDIQNKCQHEWEENGEEELNNGKTTKKSYYCSKCNKENIHYWHSL